MAKLPIDLSGREVRAALERAGFVFRRQSGSHMILRRDEPHAGVGDDAAEGARSDPLVVGYDNPGMRFRRGGESCGCHFGGGTRNLPAPGRLSLLGRKGR